VRLFGLGAPFGEAYQRIRRRLRDQHLRLIRSQSLSQLAAGALVLACSAPAALWMIWRMLQGQISLGDLVRFYQAFNQGQGLMRSLLGNLGQIYGNTLFLANMFEFLDLEPEVADPVTPTPAPARLRQGVRLRDVTFRYPRADHDALAGVSLSIGRGEVVALVGENGAGKSTLVKLLCRLYDPSAGTVTLDGVPLTELPLSKLRRLLTVAFQDPARYHLTLRENVWLGDVSQPNDDTRLLRALEVSGAARVAAGLPKGVDTSLGHWLEGGHELSVGEWQRVALARALWRDAWLVILDEPTSPMDPEAEERFWAELRPALSGRAALLISHRFSTVRQADRIYVLERGRIVESGSHDELVGTGGIYARLYASQARYYA
jgi:ATP-binding cassette subfamily B protein